MKMNYFAKLGYIDYIPTGVVGATLRLIMTKYLGYKRTYHDNYKITAITIEKNKGVSMSFTDTHDRTICMEFELKDDPLGCRLLATKSGILCHYMYIETADFVCATVSDLLRNTADIISPLGNRTMNTEYFDNTTKVDKYTALAILDNSGSDGMFKYVPGRYVAEYSVFYRAYKLINLINPEEGYIYETEKTIHPMNEDSSPEEFDISLIADLYHAVKEDKLEAATA